MRIRHAKFEFNVESIKCCYSRVLLLFTNKYIQHVHTIPLVFSNIKNKKKQSHTMAFNSKQKKLTSFFAQKNRSVNADKKQGNAVQLSKNQQLRQILNDLQSKQRATANPVASANAYHAPILDTIEAQRKAERHRCNAEKQKNKTKEPALDVLNGCKQNYFHGPTYGDHTEGKKSWKGYFEHKNKKMREQLKGDGRSFYGDLSSNGIRFNKTRHRNADPKDEEHVDMPRPAAKRRKLNEEHTDDVNKSGVSNIFKGVTVYFRGRTDDLSSFHLKKVLMMHGGNFSVHSNAKVTHCVTTNLSRSKINKCVNKIGKSRAHHVYYVNSKWITDSVRNARLMKEDDYLVFKTKNYGDIKNFFSAK
eukprot:839897_1